MFFADYIETDDAAAVMVYIIKMSSVSSNRRMSFFIIGDYLILWKLKMRDYLLRQMEKYFHLFSLISKVPIFFTLPYILL